ncbi:MAG: 8-oxo-dGTP diphosphatase MutT [Porticoccaceae bacterium]
MLNTGPENIDSQDDTPERVHVAAAVIVGGDSRILISRRPDHLHQGGLWEFPGGKVDAGESDEQAVHRELYEELSIRVESSVPFIQVSHDYPDKRVLLDFWKVTAFSGEPEGSEGQLIRWVTLDSLTDYPFPKANQSVVELLIQPRVSGT